MPNELINEEQRITRQYEIDFDDFIKFFKIEGEFQKIEIMHTRHRKIADGITSIDLNVKPWIRVITIQDTTNFDKEAKLNTDDDKDRLYL